MQNIGQDQWVSLDEQFSGSSPFTSRLGLLTHGPRSYVPLRQ